MAIYMKLTTIKGPVKQQGFEDQIELSSFGMSAYRHIPQETKSIENRSVAEAQINYVDIDKIWDGVSSTKMLESMLKGTMNMTAEISFTSQTDGGSLTYLTVKLENVGLAAHMLSCDSGGNLPRESAKLSFTKVEITPYTVGSDKKPVKGGVMHHDLSTGVNS